MRLDAKRQHLLWTLLNDSDILQENQLLVHHLMTRDLVAVEPNTKREEMIALMDENRTHHLLVCRNRDQLLGVVSDRDLSGRPGKTAEDIMTSPPFTVAADSPLNPAVAYLINKNISCLPVLDDGRLCGVITRTDLILTLQCTIQSWMQAVQHVREDLPNADELSAITKAIDNHLVDQQTRQLASFVDMRIDASTGLGSRRGLEEVLDMLLAAKNRHRTQFSLAIITIEQIEEVRNVYGDDIAERVIKTMAEKIQQLSRKNDFVSRYQYNAFAVVLTQTGLDEAHTFCDRTREQASWCDSELGIEITPKVVAVDAWAGEKPTTLLARAEAELVDSEEPLCTAG